MDLFSFRIYMKVWNKGDTRRKFRKGVSYMTAREYMAYSRQRSDNIKAIIAEHKQRKGMTDAMVAKAAGINPGTFVQRKRNPGTFRLNDLWAICNVLDVPQEQRNTIL